MCYTSDEFSKKPPLNRGGFLSSGQVLHGTLRDGLRDILANRAAIWHSLNNGWVNDALLDLGLL